MFLKAKYLNSYQIGYLQGIGLKADHHRFGYTIPDGTLLTDKLAEIIKEYERACNMDAYNSLTASNLRDAEEYIGKPPYPGKIMMVDDPKSAQPYDRDAFVKWANEYCNDGTKFHIPYRSNMPVLTYKSWNDPKNAERIKTLHPVVRKMAKQHLRLCDQQGIWLRITHGERTFAEQDLLYAQGRTMPGKIVTNAKGGQSWHNYCLAYDVVPLDYSGKAIWDTNDPIWANVIDLGKQAGLEHGIKVGKWVDMPHFQYRFDGITIAEAKELWKRGVLHSWIGVA